MNEEKKKKKMTNYKQKKDQAEAVPNKGLHLQSHEIQEAAGKRMWG